MPQIEFTFISLHISTLLMILITFSIVKMKNKVQIHYIFLVNLSAMIVWSTALLLEAYFRKFYGYTGLLFLDICFIGLCILPVSILLTGMTFANGGTGITRKHLLLFIVPVISLSVLFTNDFHHLFIVKYSPLSTEMIYGRYFTIHTIYSYGCVLIGLYYLLSYAAKNSGLFSKQALTILLGFTVPLIVNVLYTLNIIPLTVFATPLAFSFLVLCYWYATLEYDFLEVVPIALRIIVDRIPDGFVVVDTKLNIVDFNKAFMETLAHNIDKGKKQNIIDVLKSDWVENIWFDDVVEHVKEVCENRKAVAFEKHVATHSLNKYFSIEASPILVRGSFIGIIILFRDVTEIRKSLEIVTQNQDVLRKERHDFANHLNTLNAMYSLKGSDTLDRMGNYLKRLVNDSNYSSNIPKSGNICIDALISVKLHTAKQRNINFEADFDFPLSHIDIDDVALIGIIGNIIDNAFDAVALNSQDGQQIVSVYSYNEGGKAYISISNNGPKIPDSNLNSIFMKKFSTKSEKEGERGFGLYITRELITKNKGNIYVTSTESETEFLLEFNIKDAGSLTKDAV